MYILYALIYSCGTSAGLSAAPQPPLHSSLLTKGLREHLSHLLEEYQGLQEKASTNHKLYQQISSLEPVATLVQRLQEKEKVGFLVHGIFWSGE